MLTFERSRDSRLITAVFRHEKLYDASVDDFAPARLDFVCREDEAIWYVLVKDGEKLLGLFALAPQNHLCWEIHTRLLPTSWGREAAAAAKEIILWVWASTPCVRLVTSCPSYNRIAIRFAERAGLTRYGLNPRSWMKGDKLVDQVLLGISKPSPAL